ncbi:transporter substrate-binding domain-containing protein [Labrenzia aggregata]|uniref:Transporter substrate-binding domain-containing protein n=2 Tax=Roseibium aggregatum TaxID=187304 RepID=A0A939J2M7_9HYPH|nr:transporter substrate-binding domain-containing protein [Roseibium aggregatum]
MFSRFSGRVLIVLFFLTGAPLRAQESGGNQAPSLPASPVTVGLYVSPPFVMKGEEGAYTGMAVDLWEGLAEKNGLQFEYRAFPTIRELVDATADGSIGVAVTNLTITRKRADRIDFTQPWFDAGLRILVPGSQGATFSEVFEGLSDSGYLRAYGWLGLVIVVATALMTLFDRRFDKGFPTGWPEGLSESFYSVMSVVTSGKAPSRKNLFGWPGRIWQALWLVCGIAVMAYVTSSVTSVMTTLSLTNQINGIADLPGKTIGVFSGSVAEEYARNAGWSHLGYDDIDSAVAALNGGEIDAVVGDAPVLEYYAHTHPREDVEVVGPIFEPDKYGFALAHGSPWTRPMTLELLTAHENELIEDLRVRYFGDER